MAQKLVAGSSAAILVTAEGETTITFFATDAAGTAEALESIKVKLDKTSPDISGSAAPGANGFGWNNSPVTVNFGCQDALSGLLSCPGPTTRYSEGATQSVTG